MIDLKQWRASLGITQTEAANRLAMTLRHYQRLEAGASPINKRTQMLIEAVQAKE
jgi:transcriptional regulator with XRE-family HTH domain